MSFIDYIVIASFFALMFYYLDNMEERMLRRIREILDERKP